MASLEALASFSHSHPTLLLGGVSISVEGNLGGLKKAHDGNIWDMDWHPLGHVLATGSNDYSAKVGLIGPAGVKQMPRAAIPLSLSPRPTSHIPFISTVLDTAKARGSHGR